MGLLSRQISYLPLHNPASCDADREAIRKRNARLSAKGRNNLTRRCYLGPLVSLQDNCPSSTDGIVDFKTHASVSDMVAHEEDILRAPESSDEEADSIESPIAHTASRSNGDKSALSTAPYDVQTSPPKTRAKRKRVESRGQEHGNVPQSRVSSQGGFKVMDEDWLSVESSSQSRRLKRAGTTYSSQHSKDESFKAPSASPQTPAKKGNVPKLLSSFDATPKKLSSQMPEKIRTVPSPSAKVKSQDRGFVMPTDFQFSEDSEPSNGISPDASQRNRRASSSSLSSADSIADYLLEKEHQVSLMDSGKEQDSYDRQKFRCPMCKQLVDRGGLGVYGNPEKLSVKNQQRLCYKHRVREARQTWQNSGFPQISWSEILKVRVPAHVDDLIGIVRRKKPSHYLQVLDSKFKAAEGNQSKFNKYFETEVMEIVKHGYYGPKGAKLLASKIASIDELTQEINLRNRSDRTMKATSLVRMVDAVLLPELLLMLVMEDLSLEDPREANKLLSETNELGLLLQPDDDHVEQEIEHST